MRPLAGFSLQVARVVQDAVAHLGRQVQARAAVLDAFHHAHRLLVVAIERRGLGRRGDPCGAQGTRPKRRFAGVAEGGVPQVMAKRDGLSQILVQPERPCDGAGDLRHFQRMGEARAEVVALGSEEHLGLVGKPPKRFRVQNLVAIALVVGAQRVGSSLEERRPRCRRRRRPPRRAPRAPAAAGLPDTQRAYILPSTDVPSVANSRKRVRQQASNVESKAERWKPIAASRGRFREYPLSYRPSKGVEGAEEKKQPWRFSGYIN